MMPYCMTGNGRKGPFCNTGNSTNSRSLARGTHLVPTFGPIIFAWFSTLFIKFVVSPCATRQLHKIFIRLKSERQCLLADAMRPWLAYDASRQSLQLDVKRASTT
jgi:hypothetical protein